MKRLCILLLLLIAALPEPVYGQAPGLVSIDISAGFAGRFRDSGWTPVLIRIENNGTRNFAGELIIRPERSRGVINPVSSPVSLAPDTQQLFTIYVSLRSLADVLRVELLTDDGLIAAETESNVSAVLPRERLYVRVTDGVGRPVDLGSAASYGQSVVEADWFVTNLPDRGVGLEAVDLMLISNADSGQLSPDQRDAIRDWVLGGGHLIVAGGSRWQETAEGLTDLLPLVPVTSELSADLAGVNTLAGWSISLAATETVLARGTLAEDAMVLAADSAGTPLVVRRDFGYGLVDYITFDPTTPPFAGWDGLDGLWFSLVTSRDVRPGWSYGFLNLTQGYNAVEILPGVTALPEALAMIGFLLLYVVLIGPVNYLLLSRIGRREFAWFSIPVLIVVFTIIAWVTGFNLRGSEVVLSRLSVVESWPESDTSHVRQLIGLLSPRRANYEMSFPDTRSLRPLLRTTQGGFFSNQASTVEIEQSDVFSAVNFPVDASFMAGFVADGTTPRALLSGSVSVTEGDTPGILEWRGSVRNDLPVALTDVVILSRSGVIRLPEPLAPGEIRILEEEIISTVDMAVPASPLEYATTFLSPAQTRYVTRGRDELVGPEQSLKEIVGEEVFRSALFFGMPLNASAISQADQRRQTFLANFVIDQFNSTARGDNIYMIGWTEQAPFSEDIPDANWKAVDSTLYITELETTQQSAVNTLARVGPDQFTWTLIEDEAATNSTPNFISYLNRGRLSFRLTPVPRSVLSTVDELVLVIERGSSSLTNTEVRLYNWDSGEYDPITLDGDRTQVADHAPYIGPNNAVQIEIDRFLSAGALSITKLAVEQYGTRRS